MYIMIKNNRVYELFYSIVLLCLCSFNTIVYLYFEMRTYVCNSEVICILIVGDNEKQIRNFYSSNLSLNCMGVVKQII